LKAHATLKALASPDDSQFFLSEGLNELKASDGQLFYVYISAKAMIRPRASRILVSVHGYSGRKNNPRGRKQVKKYAECLSDLADEKGWVILAPHFDEKRFKNNYQTLNLTGLAADIRLNDLIAEVGNQLDGLRTDRIFLFGFSGGGQFVHRYVAFHPERVLRAVACAPGWYMWPVFFPYPVGVFLDSDPSAEYKLLKGLCSSKILILVGEKDGTQGAYRKSYQKYDLTGLQGNGRKERALNWIANMKAWAKEKRCPFNIAFAIIPKAAHSLNSRFLKCSYDYLCAHDGPTSVC
jgi:pimeloyl-ACP methyl ester carboxylesterase